MPAPADLKAHLASLGIGAEIYGLAAEIFPICRSITGDGVRETLRRLGAHVDIEIQEVPTGTQVFDWTVPLEWNIRDAFIKDGTGRRIVDFARCNLHVVSYSIPVNRTMTLAELKPHIHTIPGQPDAIPYRTSYYSEDWGFCMAHRQFESLRDEPYEVVIDATRAAGSMTYGEVFLPGETADEFVLSAHVCHPSLANDNCSGLAMLTHLAKRLREVRTRYSYRFIFAPGTIGTIAWLARNPGAVSRIKHGLVVSMLGDRGGPTYKRSRGGNAKIDRAAAHVVRQAGPSHKVLAFSPYGYDERQYCSPGFNLPVGLLQRSQFGTIPQYHTSGDNLDFITPENLETSFGLIAGILNVVEGDAIYRNTLPHCEPQLGKRGLYQAIGGDPDAAQKNMAMLWVLNLSDGEHSLLDIAETADLPFSAVQTVANLLELHGLLKKVGVT